MDRARLTHDIHTSQLRPDLRKDTNKSSVEHVWLEKIKIGNISVTAFKLAHLLDIFKFEGHEGAIPITFSVDESQNIMAVLPSVLSCKPTWRLR